MTESSVQKILVIREQSLPVSSDSYRLFERVLYDVVKVPRDNVVELTLTASLAPIKAINPTVIIAIGEKCLNFLCNLKGITRYAGTVQRVGDYQVVPIVSPGYITHNPNYLRKFSEDVLLAYQLSIGMDQIEVKNAYKIVTSYQDIFELVGHIKKTKICCFDFETTKLTDMGTFDPNFYCTLLSISFQQGSSYIIPLWHPEANMSETLISQIIDLLNKEVFGDHSIVKIGHNLKFDMHCAVWCGINRFKGPFHDTMAMHYLLSEDTSHKLKDLVREYYPRFSNYEEDVKGNWSTVPLTVLAKYAALDSDLTLRLYWEFTRELLETDERLYVLFRNMIAPATVALFYMEERGMLIDKAYLTRAISLVDTYIDDTIARMRNYPEVVRFEAHRREHYKEVQIGLLQERIEKLSATEFKSKVAQNNQVVRLANLKDEQAKLKSGEIVPQYDNLNFDSHLQLQQLLFSPDGFAFKVPKSLNNSEGTSTAKEHLDLIKDKTGFIDDLQAYRQLQKVRSTYLVSILNKLDDRHRIHTTFNQPGTKTGRLSSKNPNLQNVITRTKYKSVEDAVAFVKGSFSVPEGYTMVQADYSQAELRIIAHYADEHTMIEAYNNGIDMHELTAANSRGYTLEAYRALDPKEYKQYRFEAKAENFGFIYGISPEGFKDYARTQYGITITLKEAEKRREAFFKKYPALLKYHSDYVNKARKFGYVRTFFGQRVRLPEIHSINGGKRGHAERNAINSPIQGTAGQMTIFAVALLHIILPSNIHIVNTIHDSIIFYIPDSMLSKVIPVIQHVMENLPILTYFEKSFDKVKMVSDIEGSKKSWKDLGKLSL